MKTPHTPCDPGEISDGYHTFNERSMNTYPEHPLEDLLCECGRHLPCRHCSPDDEGLGASLCSPFDLLMGQIEAMKHRSDVYRSEAEADEDHTEAEKHMRVYMVLKELHRLGKHFEANDQVAASEKTL